MYDRLLSVVASRPMAKIVQIHDGQIDATYRNLVAVIV